MNPNTPRIDNGTPLQASELRNNVIGYGAWASRAPMAAECCTEEGADPAPRRKARVNWWGVATVTGFALSACLIGFVFVTGWRLARGLFF